MNSVTLRYKGNNSTGSNLKFSTIESAIRHASEMYALRAVVAGFSDSGDAFLQVYQRADCRRVWSLVRSASYNLGGVK